MIEQGDLLMKRSTLALVAILLAGQAALAQRAGPPRGAPTDHIAAEIGLDHAQKAELKRVMDADRARHEAEMNQAVRGVLTAEQFEQFKKLQQERVFVR